MTTSSADASFLILAVAHLPPGEEAEAAAISGLSPSDVRLRLSGTFPRILLFSNNAEELRRISAGLEKRGFITLLFDPGTVEADKDRIVARTLELSADGFCAIDRQNARYDLLGAEVTLIQRGVRSSSTSEVATTSERKISLTKAALSGGLLWSKQSKKTEVRVSESREAFLLVHVLDGKQDIILYEKRLDYRFLGGDLKPAAFGNLLLTLERLRKILPNASLDERVAQPTFIQRLAIRATIDPIDLALHLVKLDHLARKKGSPRA
jgi:hypothetical protein